MHIIGFGCTARVGKDTAAQYLERKYPARAKRVAFADKLKKIAMDLFGLSYEQCYGSKEEKEAIDPRYGKSPRQIMQELGEKMREIYPDVWIDTIFYTTIPALEEKGFDCFVVADTRYPNEGDGIHSRGGTVVKVNREGAGVEAGKDHSSETAMLNYKKFDFIIDNNGTFEEYYAKIDQMMEKIGYGNREERKDDD